MVAGPLTCSYEVADAVTYSTYDEWLSVVASGSCVAYVAVASCLYYCFASETEV